MEKKQALEEIRSRIVAQGNEGRYRNVEGETHRTNNDDKSHTTAATGRGVRKDDRSTQRPPDQNLSAR